MARAIHSFTASDAAREIHALMNQRPSLPHRHELEAIIAKVATPAASPLLCFNAAVDEERRQWRALMVARDEALLHQDDVEQKCGSDSPETAAARAAEGAIEDKLGELEGAIWDRDARGIADIDLIADTLVNQIWPGRSLTEDFNGGEKSKEKRAAWTLEDAVESGPECCGDHCDLALEALLVAIRDLLVRPAGDGVKGDAALLTMVRTAIARHDAAERRAIELDDEDEDANREREQAYDGMWLHKTASRTRRARRCTSCCMRRLPITAPTRIGTRRR